MRTTIKRAVAATFTLAAIGTAPVMITASAAAPQAGGVEQLGTHGGTMAGGVEQLGLKATPDGGVEQL